MIAVIFEAWPNEGRVKEYLDVAASLRPLLDTIDGFISIERFESLTEPGKILSLSFWRDEEAIENWRRIESHREAQSRGRGGIFKDYRLMKWEKEEGREFQKRFRFLKIVSPEEFLRVMEQNAP